MDKWLKTNSRISPTVSVESRPLTRQFGKKIRVQGGADIYLKGGYSSLRLHEPVGKLGSDFEMTGRHSGTAWQLGQYKKSRSYKISSILNNYYFSFFPSIATQAIDIRHLCYPNSPIIQRIAVLACWFQ